MHTRTHRTQARARAHARTHARTQTHSLAQWHTRTHTDTQSHTVARAHACTHTPRYHLHTRAHASMNNTCAADTRTVSSCTERILSLAPLPLWTLSRPCRGLFRCRWSPQQHWPRLEERLSARNSSALARVGGPSSGHPRLAAAPVGVCPDCRRLFAAAQVACRRRYGARYRLATPANAPTPRLGIYWSGA